MMYSEVNGTASISLIAHIICMDMNHGNQRNCGIHYRPIRSRDDLSQLIHIKSCTHNSRKTIVTCHNFVTYIQVQFAIVASELGVRKKVTKIVILIIILTKFWCDQVKKRSWELNTVRGSVHFWLLEVGGDSISRRKKHV